MIYEIQTCGVVANLGGTWAIIITTNTTPAVLSSGRDGKWSRQVGGTRCGETGETGNRCDTLDYGARVYKKFFLFLHRMIFFSVVVGNPPQSKGKVG